MAEPDLIGKARPRRAVSLDKQRKLLVSLKGAIAMALGGILVIYWEHLTTPPIGDALAFLPLVMILFTNAVYSFPTQILLSVEFMVASVVGSASSLVVFYIMDHHSNSYYGTIVIFIFAVLLIASDRTKKHVMFVKLTLIFFVIQGLLMPVPTVKDFGKETLWILVYSTILGVTCALLTSCLIFPIFQSHYIIPAIIEVIEECRNLYSDIAFCLESGTQLETNSANEAARDKSEEAKKQMLQTEKELSAKINLVNGYIQGSAIEFWDAALIGKYKVLFDTVLRTAFQLVALQRLVSHEEFFPPVPPIHILRETHCEILRYFDELVDQAMSVHGIAHSKLTTKAKGWPKSDKMKTVLAEVHEAYHLIVQDYRSTNKPLPSRPVLRHGALMIGLQGLVKNLPVTAHLLKEFEPISSMAAYKKVPKAAYKCAVFSFKRMYQDFGFGIFEELKQKKALKAHLVDWWKSLKLKYALQYATVISLTYPWTIYLYEKHSEAIHMDVSNRIWLMTTVIIVILPAMGGTLGRGIHRIVGTIIGAPIGHLLGWAVLAAGGPESASRWGVMEVLFFVLMFLGSTIQQIPGTGYAAMLGTLTVFLVPTPYLHSTLSHPPTHIFITRIVFIALTSVWVGFVFTVLIPTKSVDNLEGSLIDCMCTTGKAFATLMRAGLIDENGEPECTINEKTRKEVGVALKTLYATQQNYATLLQDARFEVWMLRRKYKQYAAAVEQAHEVYLSVASMLSVYGDGFSTEIKRNLVVPTRASIDAATVPIEQKVAEISALRLSTS